MYRAEFKVTFIRSFFMHRDDVPSQDLVTEWRKDPKNKEIVKKAKGDDRCPVWVWKTYLHHDEEFVSVPSDMIMGCLRESGKDFKEGKASMKARTQSYIQVEQEYMHLHLHNNKRIKLDQINKIKDNWSFDKHEKAVTDLGFTLDIRRVYINRDKKHVRVRPRFLPDCYFSGTLIVSDEEVIPFELLTAIFKNGGEMKGLGDWRPGAPKCPGPHGKFTVELSLL